jgi:hypothetical protein
VAEEGFWVISEERRVFERFVRAQLRVFGDGRIGCGRRLQTLGNNSQLSSAQRHPKKYCTALVQLNSRSLELWARAKKGRGGRE